MMFFGFYYGIYATSVFKVIAGDSIDDKITTLAGAIGCISNGISRLGWAIA